MITEEDLTGKINLIQESLSFFIPEIILGSSVVFILFLGLLLRSRVEKIKMQRLLLVTAAILIMVSASLQLFQLHQFVEPENMFGMLRNDNISTYLKILFDTGGLFTLLMSFRKEPGKYITEYISLIFAIVLGSHLLVMSVNFVMVFLSLELISLSSYVLAGFSFNRQGTEGSMKYFLFGSVASAIMVYGFSILYGLTGTLHFSSAEFSAALMPDSSPLFFISTLMCLAGFLYKIAAVPMHPWAPDIYEAAPIPVVAFFSVVPKLAGIGILVQFMRALNLSDQPYYDWQFIVSVISIITLTVGNFSALWQKRPKRLMAYSSIAQSGFLLTGIAAMLPEGIHFMLFYAAIYLVMNFLVFLYLQYFEDHNIIVIDDFAGQSRRFAWPLIALLIGLISLTGLPPTGGFMAKIFIFSSLWKAYESSEKSILMWLLIVGLLNTVVSLFYYLRIPYYAFLKPGTDKVAIQPANSFTFTNFFGLILVLLILLTFLQPNLLMGWINRINFVF